MDANVHEGEGLTPQAAVAEIRRIEGLHGALARRASGLTWMIWGIAAIAVTKVPVVEFAWVLMAQGLGVVTVGLLGLNCNDATERRLWILGGILLVATALVGSLLLGGEILLARQWFTLISPLTSGLVLFGGGLYLTSRA